MTEKNRQSPEGKPAQEPHVCPTCERGLIEMQDYPRVFLTSVSVGTVDDIPTEIPNFYSEDLFVEPVEGWQRELVPASVIQYFNEHPDQESFAHTDSYIYHRPYNQTKAFARNKEQFSEGFKSQRGRSVRDDRYSRNFNRAPGIRTLFTQDSPLSEYLTELAKLEGQEVPTKVLFPQWERLRRDGLFIIPTDSETEENESFYLNFRHGEESSQIEQRLLTGIEIWGDGPNIGSAGGPTFHRLVPIGTLQYEGRINQI